MDGANADSDHSMTWEDFFVALQVDVEGQRLSAAVPEDAQPEPNRMVQPSRGSTTDLTPTLIGIYDSLLEPAESQGPEVTAPEKAKDARNDPPVTNASITEENNANPEPERVTERNANVVVKGKELKMAGRVKLPVATINKSSLYSIRSTNDENGASDSCVLSTSDTAVLFKDKLQRTVKESKPELKTFDNLSPNVKRMISSANETTTVKFQRKGNVGRSSARLKSNIPLVGATSKISQSGVEILPSVEIYDQPSIGLKTKLKTDNESPSKTIPLKPSFKIDEQTTYDVPTNNRPAIYDVPNAAKTAFESLSLPYIDQSIELSISSNDREFDTKLSSKENSPTKPENSPAKIQKVNGDTNSLNRIDFKESPSKKLCKIPYPEAVASTGNLKCAIPEKDMARLNPPSLEVTRPLSMSSIASSSSTSSSGVQNKGGVNSAYLASIESLDDHSDVDVVSANGSNNFVNSAGASNTPSEERHSESPRHQVQEHSGLSLLERVCAEIIQTENVYVEDLRQVVEGYLHEWRRDAVFAEDELAELFNNIEDIYNFNRLLCEELNTCQLDATCIARCFVNNTTGFSVYTSYCTGYPRTMERLAALASVPQSAREFRERQLALEHPLPLASYLLKPVQRILKYHLLLQNVVKQCASSETEYALLKMTAIAQHIDHMKRRHEHAVRVQEIQSLLYGWVGPDLTTYGELCAEGTFRVFGAKAMRHAFLFDKMLLVTKNREDGILAYKSHIMCNNMMLVESIAGAPLSFHVIPWDAPRAQLTLQARSHRHKREWTLLLKRVILENYNAVIPSHARQLVMELGQNRTDDDILAEKSHGLITQASMRKQLSAPEYLEKRKLERERRKTFDNGNRGRLKKANRKYTLPSSRSETRQCDCTQFSAEKGIDYTCDACYVDLCSDCETELNKDKSKDKCGCRDEINDVIGDKCPECDRSLHYIDAGSAENLERKPLECKCSDFKSSQESFSKEYPSSLNKTRGYHSSDNIAGFTETCKSKEDLSCTNSSLLNVRNMPKTCLKCAKIKENIAVTNTLSPTHVRKSRCSDSDKFKTDTLRSKSRDDPQRSSRLSKISAWRRKSEPGLQQNPGILTKKSHDTDPDKNDSRGTEKIEFECRNCGSNKISRKGKNVEGMLLSDTEVDIKKRGATKSNIEIKMYNTKHVPKKISKLKKNRAKGLRMGSDTTAKFYTDFSTDMSTENILHISESNDSLPNDRQKDICPNPDLPIQISKDDDIDEETYKKLIEKTDSFKKNELEKVKYLHKQKVINEGSEAEDKIENAETKSEVDEPVEETEQPLEQIISQLLLQNREFQKLLKKQQQRNSAQRRHQRLLKSHSNPEEVIIAKINDGAKLKPKYNRQTSENLSLNKNDETDAHHVLEKDDDAEDHIYETLRVESKSDEPPPNLSNKSKITQHNTQIPRPKRLPSPPKPPQNIPEVVRPTALESDYVYLSFDKINSQSTEGIYDVPVKSPEKVEQRSKSIDYYVAMEKQGPPTNEESVYDNLMEVCRRKKDVPTDLPSEYLPMNVEQQSPNTPEIWLSRQKEHFNVSRDRKSGSLPRSFQVLTTNQEETNLSSFKCKPNTNSKTYLNRDGKVMSTDRPFTIASDQSELSYDDVENYINDSDLMKFNKKLKSNESQENLSQSTLELEEEIDRCYKNNFEVSHMDKNKNESLLTVSQPNLDVSINSSCEVLPLEKVKDAEILHPEHKIYKPTSNMLSLKNVLSRFRNRTPNKSNDEIETNANDESTPESIKSDPKSPGSEKKSGLNPRSYSKNLLQRFRSIIGDEHTEDSHTRSESPVKSTKANSESQNNIMKSEIKVVITSTDASPTTSTIIYSLNNDALSKSVCEHTTLTESQNEKNNLDELSHSCDNIPNKQEMFRPNYEKSVSMITTTTASMNSSNTSQTKSVNSSYQSLNKLPIYMQGSKLLGARIAQSDYADPTALISEKSPFKNTNVLINKSAVRPDSLFSNSSFVTSSSEGAYQDANNKASEKPAKSDATEKSSDSSAQINSDDSYYEKSFEKIEQVTDEDVFRDSAVYSDQDDSEETKTENSKGRLNKTVVKVESVKRNSSFNTQKVTVTTSITEKNSVHSRLTITPKNPGSERQTSVNNSKNKIPVVLEKTKPKVAPPVPVKPKLTCIPSSSFAQKSFLANRVSNLAKSQEVATSNESIDTKTIKRNATYKHNFTRAESTPNEEVNRNESKDKVNRTISVNEIEYKDDVDGSLKPHGSIQLKRLSFERASLDSATRKIKFNNTEKRLSSTESPKGTSKTVQERRMEIESKSQIVKPTIALKKPTQIMKPKSITTKVATFENNGSDNVKRDSIPSFCTDRNIPPVNDDVKESKAETNDIDAKASWVKQVVNKFQ